MASRVLDFKDIGNLFGTKSERAVTSDKLLPDVPLHVERLKQMDASVDYDAADIRSRDFPLRGVHTHIDLQNAVLTLQPLAFQFAYGRLSGMLKIDAHRTVAVTTVDARITDVKVEQFLGANPAATGLLEARARVTGSGNSVRQVASTANGPSPMDSSTPRSRNGPASTCSTRCSSVTRRKPICAVPWRISIRATA